LERPKQRQFKNHPYKLRSYIAFHWQKYLDEISFGYFLSKSSFVFVSILMWDFNRCKNHGTMRKSPLITNWLLPSITHDYIGFINSCNVQGKKERGNIFLQACQEGHYQSTLKPGRRVFFVRGKIPNPPKWQCEKNRGRGIYSQIHNKTLNLNISASRQGIKNLVSRFWATNVIIFPTKFQPSSSTGMT